MNVLSNKNEIYKYYPFTQYSLQVLINRELWLGPPDKLNDPFEGDFIISNIEDYHNRPFIEKLLRLKRVNFVDDILFGIDLNSALDDINFFARVLYNYVNGLIMSRYGISSFSKTPYEIKMWTHYADSHKGFCLLFDRGKLNLNLSDQELDLMDVDYKNLPVVNIVDEKDIIDIYVDNSFMLHKLKDWADEKEVRIVKRDDFVIANSRFAKFDDYSLIGVVFGPRLEVENMKTLVKLIDYYSNKSINFYSAYKDLQSNCIKIRRHEQSLKRFLI